MNAPQTFELQGIRLRLPKVSDAAAVFEYGSDPEVARYADWPVRTTVEPLVESLRERSDEWGAEDNFYWIIALPDTDRAIGGITCSIDGHAAEIGFLVNRHHWGRGIATEAAKAIADWALSLPPIWRVWATCDAENLASARVLQKIGMSREGILRRWSVRPNISNEPRDAYVYARVRTTP